MSLVGRRFNRWVVKSVGVPYVFPKCGSTKTRYNCLCDCGSEKLIREDTLLNGNSQSCGCLAKELSSERAKTHGLSRHELYGVWHDMIRRCTEPSRKDYKHYGGRGISVCKEWSDPLTGLQKFIEDMYPTFSAELELDRIDVNGNYQKDNCRWATRRDQVINRRAFGNNFDTKLITYNNETLCISQWAEKVGLPSKVLVDRLGKLKWDIDKALKTPLIPNKIHIEIGGEVFYLKDIFKYPSYISAHSKKIGKETHQLCADMFYGIGDVYIHLGKEIIKIEPKENSSEYLNRLHKTDYFAKYGVEL